MQDDGLVLPQLGDARGELQAAEDHLPAARDEHLRELVDRLLHELLDLGVVEMLEMGGQKRQEVIKALPARAVRLSGGERLDRVQYGDLGTLGWAGDGCVRSRAVGHQTVVEEVPQVIVSTEWPHVSVLHVVNVKVARAVSVSDALGEHEQHLLLTQLVVLLLS